MSVKANLAFIGFIKINRNIQPKAFCLRVAIILGIVAKQVVIPLGLEPRTTRLKVECSTG